MMNNNPLMNAFCIAGISALVTAIAVTELRPFTSSKPEQKTAFAAEPNERMFDDSPDIRISPTASTAVRVKKEPKGPNHPGTASARVRRAVPSSEVSLRLQPSAKSGGRMRKSDDQQKVVATSQPLKRLMPLSVFPELATARAKDHRIIQLTFSKFAHESPTTGGVAGTQLATSKRDTKELEVVYHQVFVLADELSASRGDGSVLSTDSLLEAVRQETVVVVTHEPLRPPAGYLAAFVQDIILLQIPYTPEVPISAKTFGETKSSNTVAIGVAGASPPLAVYPELCTARARIHGIVEITSNRLEYRIPQKRGETAIRIAMGTSSMELTLSPTSNCYLATELRSYRPDGTTLSRDELLGALEANSVVLATLSPSRPRQSYLDVLHREAIVIEIPSKPLIRVSAENLMETWEAAL